MTPTRTFRTGISALARAAVLAVCLLSIAAPVRADLADEIRERIDLALGWLVPTTYHEDAGFYMPDEPHWFWVFDTVQVVWLLDWLEEQGWDVAEYMDEVENARAFLDAARADDGSWYWEGPSELHRDTETTALASLLAPSPLSDQWIVDHQLPDGHWDELAPTVEDQDYPTSTGFAMYAATCRNYQVDFAKAYEWYQGLDEADWYPSGDYYKTRFYATYLLGSLAKLRDDFPDAGRVKLRELITYFHDGNGSFEGRTMDDNPSAIVPVALAMQTAIQLDDPDLEDEIYLAGLYLRENFAGDHWDRGTYTPDWEKDESLFATVHAIRALALAYFDLLGVDYDPCVNRVVPGDDDDDDDGDDDTTDDDDDLLDDDSGGDDDVGAGDDDAGSGDDGKSCCG